MGLMYARRAAAKKQIEANKARAHAENHKAAHAAFAKDEAEKALKAEAATLKQEPVKKP